MKKIEKALQLLSTGEKGVYKYQGHTTHASEENMRSLLYEQNCPSDYMMEDYLDEEGNCAFLNDDVNTGVSEVYDKCECCWNKSISNK